MYREMEVNILFILVCFGVAVVCARTCLVRLLRHWFSGSSTSNASTYNTTLSLHRETAPHRSSKPDFTTRQSHPIPGEKESTHSPNHASPPIQVDKPLQSLPHLPSQALVKHPIHTRSPAIHLPTCKKYFSPPKPSNPHTPLGANPVSSHPHATPFVTPHAPNPSPTSSLTRTGEARKRRGPASTTLFTAQ